MVASAPPLMPINDDASPTINPYPVIARRPGKRRPSTQLSRPTRSLAAFMLAISTKATLRTVAGAKAAVTEPTATPATAGNAHDRIIAGMTRPFARWAQYDRTVVGTMMASDVPTQSCMRTSSGTPKMRKISNNTGTTTMPPPIPNSPARIPVTTPAAITATASQTSSLKGMLASMCRGSLATLGDEQSPRSRATVAAQQLDQIVDALPMLTAINRVVHVSRTLLCQHNPRELTEFFANFRLCEGLLKIASVALAGLRASAAVHQGHGHARRPEPGRQGAHRRIFRDVHAVTQCRDGRIL